MNTDYAAKAKEWKSEAACSLKINLETCLTVLGFLLWLELAHGVAMPSLACVVLASASVAFGIAYAGLRYWSPGLIILGLAAMVVLLTLLGAGVVAMAMHARHGDSKWGQAAIGGSGCFLFAAQSAVDFGLYAYWKMKEMDKGKNLVIVVIKK